MTKIYEEKPADGEILKKARKLNPRLLALDKVEALRQAGDMKGKKRFSFLYDIYEVEIRSIKAVNVMVQIHLRVWKEGKQVDLGALNPLKIYNPSVCVYTGTWRKETLPDGSEIDIENVKEDPQEALKQEIIQFLNRYHI